jgi:peptidoglycan/xylan/chitin deacetylase (PgdA/CDA1 family)
MNASFNIIDIFAKYRVPLSVGVITGQGDCYQPGLLRRYNQSNGLLEIASHTVSHIPMTTLSYNQQLDEATLSKRTLENSFGQRTVRTFIPPENSWNYSTITAIRAAGYDIISPQCTVSQTTWPAVDYMCSSNMYRNRPIYFPRIDGIIHMPTGSSISSFTSGQLISANQLFNGTNDDCTQRGICSVRTQLNATNNQFSVVMMHPQDFPQENITSIESYLAPILQIAKLDLAKMLQEFLLSKGLEVVAEQEVTAEVLAQGIQEVLAQVLEEVLEVEVLEVPVTEVELVVEVECGKLE